VEMAESKETALAELTEFYQEKLQEMRQQLEQVSCYTTQCSTVCMCVCVNVLILNFQVNCSRRKHFAAIKVHLFNGDDCEWFSTNLKLKMHKILFFSLWLSFASAILSRAEICQWGF